MHVLLHSVLSEYKFLWDNSASICSDSEVYLLTIVNAVVHECILTCCQLHIILTSGISRMLKIKITLI